MADTLIAQTNIKWSDGSNKVRLSAGEEVKGIPEDVVEQLKSSGAVAEPAFALGREELQQRLAELEAENDELRRQAAIANGPAFEQNLTQSQSEHAEPDDHPAVGHADPVEPGEDEIEDTGPGHDTQTSEHQDDEPDGS